MILAYRLGYLMKEHHDTQVEVRCRQDLKESLSRKLIACGYIYPKGTEALPSFAKFLEALDSKDLKWFRKNFRKGVDNS
jgi:hypothetical protein